MTDDQLRRLIAENIAYYRKQNGDTQAELAEKLSYSDKSVSKWERGDGTPDIFILSKIASLYNISVQDLLRQKKVAKAQARRLLITLLSVGVVWLVAAVLFCAAAISHVLEDKAWLLFLYSIPISGIVCEVFSALWWNRLMQGVSCTMIIWGIGVSLVLSLPVDSAFWLFLVCGVLEVMLILFLLLKVEAWIRDRKTRRDAEKTKPAPKD